MEDFCSQIRDVSHDDHEQGLNHWAVICETSQEGGQQREQDTDECTTETHHKERANSRDPINEEDASRLFLDEGESFKHVVQHLWNREMNSLASERCGSNFKSVP